MLSHLLERALGRIHQGGGIARFAEVVRATVKGNVIIATLQGTIGGVTFWLLGIPGALVWGAIMVFLSLLPAIGAALGAGTNCGSCRPALAKLLVTQGSAHVA